VELAAPSLKLLTITLVDNIDILEQLRAEKAAKKIQKKIMFSVITAKI
jgi:hypothetical protein